MPRFRQAKPGPHDRTRRHKQQEVENDAPAGKMEDDLSNAGGQDRNHDKDHHDEGHDARHFASAEAVANNGKRDDAGSRGAEPLQDARGEQPYKRAGGKRKDRSGDVQAKPPARSGCLRP